MRRQIYGAEANPDQSDTDRFGQEIAEVNGVPVQTGRTYAENSDLATLFVGLTVSQFVETTSSVTV